MSYHVTRNADGQPRLLLDSEPPYCKALEAAPSAREPELNIGRWLIMAFAAWSVPDIEAIQIALDVAKRFGGVLQLGLRPFDDPADHGAWSPGLSNEEASPVWILLSDGGVRLERRGRLTRDQLIQAIEESRLARLGASP